MAGETRTIYTGCLQWTEQNQAILLYECTHTHISARLRMMIKALNANYIASEDKGRWVWAPVAGYTLAAGKGPTARRTLSSSPVHLINILHYFSASSSSIQFIII